MALSVKWNPILYILSTKNLFISNRPALKRIDVEISYFWMRFLCIETFAFAEKLFSWNEQQKNLHAFRQISLLMSSILEFLSLRQRSYRKANIREYILKDVTRALWVVNNLRQKTRKMKHSERNWVSKNGSSTAGPNSISMAVGQYIILCNHTWIICRELSFGKNLDEKIV